MSKDLKNIEEEIMSKIREGQIKMKPKYYFILGSVFTFLGLVSTIVISTLSISIISFLLRTKGGPMSQYKLDKLLNEFPWYLILFAIFCLFLGFYLIKKYDFSYKVKPAILIVIFILAIFISGFFIDMIGFNDILKKTGPMKGLMRKYSPQSQIKPIHFQRIIL